MTRYLTVGDVLRIHCRENDTDEPVFDFGKLEAAVMRPQQSIGGFDAYPDIHTKAAALMHSLIRTHPFFDGNKRTAVVSVGTFYKLNGMELHLDTDQVIALALDVAEGLIDVDGIVGELKGRAFALELPEWDDPE